LQRLTAVPLIVNTAIVVVIFLAVTAPIGIIAGRGDRASAAARTLAGVGVALELVSLVLAYAAFGPGARFPNYGAPFASLLLLAVGDLLGLVACATAMTNAVTRGVRSDLWWLGAALVVLLLAPATFVYVYFGVYYPWRIFFLAVVSALALLGAAMVAVWGTRAARTQAG